MVYTMAEKMEFRTVVLLVDPLVAQKADRTAVWKVE